MDLQKNQKPIPLGSQKLHRSLKGGGNSNTSNNKRKKVSKESSVTRKKREAETEERNRKTGPFPNAKMRHGWGRGVKKKMIRGDGRRTKTMTRKGGFKKKKNGNLSARERALSTLLQGKTT